jgi:hypothetical protein
MVLVATRQQPGARRPADGAGGIAVLQDDPVFRKGINVGGGDVGAAVEAHIAIAEVVGKQDQDVGFSDFRFRASRHSENPGKYCI